MAEMKVSNNPGCIIQLIWWLLIGWWAGAIWVSVAWFLMATVIGIPAGIWMINRVSQVIALRAPDDTLLVAANGVVKIGTRQVNIVLRIIYFFLIGLWLSGVWMTVAYFLCTTVILLPAGFWMFDKTPAILTLARQ